MGSEGPTRKARSSSWRRRTGMKQVNAASLQVGTVAVLLGAIGMVSLGKAVFLKPPLGVVSFAENLIMAAMGAVMLNGRRPALRP